MQIEAAQIIDIPLQGNWSHGLYVWLPERDLSFGRAKAGIFQLDFVFRSEATSLKEVVHKYVEQMQANPNGYAPGKYNVRIIDQNGQVVSVNVKVSN